MEPGVYQCSIDAYKAIHCGLAAAVESMLELCEYHDAIKFADMMRQLELDHLIPHEEQMMKAYSDIYYPEGEHHDETRTPSQD